MGGSERERLQRAMIELCVERGWEAASGEALAERCGLPVERFEELFPGGAEECMTATEGAVIAEVMGVVSGNYLADRSDWDNGLVGMIAILELFARDPAKAYFGYVTVPAAGPRAVREGAEAGRQLLAAMIDRLRETAPGSAAPPRAARAALGAADVLLRRELAAGRAEHLPDLIPDLVYAVTVPFLGQEEALRMARRGRELVGRGGGP